MSMLICDLPNDERPRERLARLGAAALSERELLAILLRTGAAGKSALSMATELLQQFPDGLPQLAKATEQELCTLKGLGPAKAMALAAAFELARRMAVAALPQNPVMASPELVASYMRTRFHQNSQEEFHVLMLDARNQVIREEMVTLGLLDRSLVHAREVFRPAIRAGCLKVMVCHNHPSGDPRPSREDIDLTISLIAAGKILDIRLLDHIILGTPEVDPARLGYYSFTAHGQINADHR